MYADIHCHPAKVAYDSAFMAYGDEGGTHPLDPWNIPQSNLSHQSKGLLPAEYSQCDLAKSTQARVKLMFAALYPIEKGFFYGLNGGRISKSTISDYFSQVHFAGQQKATNWLIEKLRQLKGMENLKRDDFSFLKSRLMQLPLERVRFMQNGHYDYFEELKREYRFFLSKAGQKSYTPDQLKLEPKGPQKPWGGVYQLAQNGRDVLHRLRPDNEDVIIVFTLEGIHSLGVGNPEDGGARPTPSSKDVSVGRLKSRIRQLKGDEPLEDDELKLWQHCPFYITFATHFNNTLCGHARSFTDLSRWMFDQTTNMDKGVVRESAYEVMKELLGLDEQLNSTGAKRILIDIKHMSAAARHDFYKTIIRPFNKKAGNENCKIPVIASHVGYSGIDTLAEMMLNTKNGVENDHFKKNQFLAWNINLSDEDVVEIHNSGGLIGISFDKHLLGASPDGWLKTFTNSFIDNRKSSMRMLYQTLKEFVRIPFHYRLRNPFSIWDILCIGTGFDGVIDPINRYSTVLDLPRLEEDLIDILSRIKKENPNWFDTDNIEFLARKICFENAYNFVCNHY